MRKLSSVIVFIICLSVLMVGIGLAQGGTTRFVSQNGGTFTGGTMCNGKSTISASTFSNNTTNNPGDLDWLCGVIGQPVNVRGSGVSGNVITIDFDSGARISVPNCGTSWCLNIGNYTLIDGLVPCGPGTNCSILDQQNPTGYPAGVAGIIEQTDNGEGYDSTNCSTQGIEAGGNDEVRNIIIRNIFKTTASQPITQGGCGGGDEQAFQSGGSNNSLHDLTCHDAGTCWQNGSASYVSLYNSYFWNYNWGFQDGNGTPSNPATNISIHDNHFGASANWSDQQGNEHHDDIFLFDNCSNGNDHCGLLQNIWIYNNLFDQDPGRGTARIYFGGGQEQSVYVFNNVFNNAGTQGNSNALLELTGEDTQTAWVYNNTIIGSGNYSLETGCVQLQGTVVFVNNIVEGCNTLVEMQYGTYGGGPPTITQMDYNTYGPVGANAWQSVSATYTSLTGGGGWQSYAGESHSTFTPNGINLDSNGIPLTGSPAISNGANLGNIANGQLATLAFDTTEGGIRTSSARVAPWTVGAYNANGSGGPPPPSTCATPVIIPNGGTFSNPQTVSITDSNCSTIYLTFDGSQPSTSSVLYVNPFVLSNTTTIKAIGTQSGFTNSPSASQTYTIVSAVGQATATIGTTYQTIDGFGASNAFCPNDGGWDSCNLSGSQLDQVFSPTAGIGLSILRVEVPDDGSCSGNCNLTGQGTAQGAVQRGARIMATPWSPPTSMKSNGNIIAGSLSNYGGFAQYLLNFVQQFGNIYALSIQNEPDANVGYDSAVYSDQNFHDFIANNLGPLFRSNNIATKIVLPEPQGFYDFTAYADTTMNDGNAAQYVGIVAFHGYDNSFSMGNQYARNGLSFWQTEDSGGDNGTPGNGNFGPSLCGGCWDPSMADALMWQNIIDYAFTGANENGWVYWWLVNNNNDNEGLISNSGQISKRFYMLGNYSKFVRPGWQRFDITHNPQGNVAASAYMDPSGTGNFAFVFANTNGSGTSQTVNLNGFSATSVTPWLTDAGNNLTQQNNVAVAGNSFTYTLPPNSVVTFAGTTAVATPTAATPVILPGPGSYSSPQQVSMSCSTPNSVMFYTINNSTPTHASTQYTAAFSLVLPATVKAICTATNYNDSAVASSSYQPIAQTIPAMPTPVNVGIVMRGIIVGGVPVQ